MASWLSRNLLLSPHTLCTQQGTFQAGVDSWEQRNNPCGRESSMPSVDHNGQ